MVINPWLNIGTLIYVITITAMIVFSYQDKSKLRDK